MAAQRVSMERTNPFVVFFVAMLSFAVGLFLRGCLEAL